MLCLTKALHTATSMCCAGMIESFSSFRTWSASMSDSFPRRKHPLSNALLSRETPATEHALPKSIEGCRVVPKVVKLVYPADVSHLCTNVRLKRDEKSKRVAGRLFLSKAWRIGKPALIQMNRSCSISANDEQARGPGSRATAQCHGNRGSSRRAS